MRFDEQVAQNKQNTECMNSAEQLKVDVRSEVGELEAVILHTPGPEIENMTPGNAQNALYGDILNLSVAQQEYAQLDGILRRFTKVYEVKDLLEQALCDQAIKERLVGEICVRESISQPRELLDMAADQLSRVLIEGLVMNKNTLTKFFSKERYLLPPLHNFFFTRDSAVAIRDDVLVCRMANRVRERESLIMEAIFDSGAPFSTRTHRPPTTSVDDSPPMAIEGGDVLVAREDVLIIGKGARTSTTGIDYVLEKIKLQNGMKRHVIVQELPREPESFIHIDMVFTMLDVDHCMVYEPLLRSTKYHTVHIEIEKGRINFIKYADGLLDVLKELGLDLKPIACGGKKDSWVQEREQWHSGANFFAIGPGRIIGYARNSYTMDELNKEGYEILRSKDVLSGRVDPEQHRRFVIALEGSELPRGGGGARCMTMPVRRRPVTF